MPKKRSHGDGGLFYIPSRGLWRGTVDDGFWPDGRRKQRYVHGKTQTEARRKLNALKDEIAQYGAPLDKTMTVAAWSDHWLETVCRPHMKPAPLKGYRSVVRTWIVPTIGQKRMAQLKPSDLRAVSDAIHTAGRSSSTALKAHTIMSAMLESARLDGVVGRNVARDVIAPKAAKSQRGALPIGAPLRMLEVAGGIPDGTRWWMAILTGMRQGERLGATLDSIDFEQGLFTVQWSLTEATFTHGCGGVCSYKRAGSCPERRLVLADGLEYRQLDGRLILVRPKSGRPRTFPLIPQVAAALHRYLVATDHMPNPHGLIWRNADGSPITPKQDNAAWRDLLDKAGVEAGPTTHWARHTTASVLYELGIPAKVIGEIIGHSTEEITDRHYLHVSDPQARAAMEALGGHWSKALG